MAGGPPGQRRGVRVAPARRRRASRQRALARGCVDRQRACCVHVIHGDAYYRYACGCGAAAQRRARRAIHTVRAHRHHAAAGAGARASATLEWPARPGREPILSYVGAADPYTGTAWGRVVSSGVDARLYSMLDTRWSVSARTQWAQLAGEQVEDNGRVAVDVSINRALRWRGMD